MLDVVEPPVSQSSSPASFVIASAAASAMLTLSLCYRAPRRWPCAQLSLCHSARSACDQLFVAQAFAAIWAQQLKLLARVHKPIGAALGYCTLCHLFAHHQLLVLGFRTCRLAVPVQSSPGRFRQVERFCFCLVCVPLVHRQNSKKATRDRRLRRAGLDEPVRCRLQITAAPPATRR